MHTIRTAAVAAFTAVTAAAAFLVTAPVSAAPGDAWVDSAWVGTTPGADPDGAGPATSYGTDSFSTITDALNAAAVDVTIAPGTYQEQLFITADVSFHGAGVAATVIKAPAVLAVAPGGTQRAVISVLGADVNFDNLTVAGPQTPGGDQLNVGIYILGGGSATADNIEIVDISDTVFNGTQTGHGIMVGDNNGETGNLSITDSHIRRYQKTGIIVRAGSTATIDTNNIEGWGTQSTSGVNGLQVQGSALITGNTITGHRDTFPSAGFALAMFAPTGPVTVTGNTLSGNELGIYVANDSPQPIVISDNAITGLENGIDGFDSYGLYAANTYLDLTVTGNTISEHTYGVLDSSAGGSFTGNNIFGNVIGIYTDAVGSEFNSNTIANNATGVEVVGVATTLTANRIFGNTVGATGTGSGGPNWWGCNTGPGTVGCDSITGTYSEPVWLVAAVTPTACTTPAGVALPIDITLTGTSDNGTYTDHFVPATVITSIATDNGTMSAASAPVVNGAATVDLVAATVGGAQMTADIDNAVIDTNQSLCGSIAVTAAPNVAPVADAGPDAAVSGGAPVALDGTASSDADDDPITYSWTQIAGPAVTLTGANTATPTFTAPNTDGPLTFQLVVNDGTEDSAPATVTITVTAVAPPVVTPADPTVTGEEGTVTGQLNGTDNSNTSLTWTLIDAPSDGVLVLNPDGSFTYTPAADSAGGDRTFTYELCDGLDQCVVSSYTFSTQATVPTTTTPPVTTVPTTTPTTDPTTTTATTIPAATTPPTTTATGSSGDLATAGSNTGTLAALAAAALVAGFLLVAAARRRKS